MCKCNKSNPHFSWASLSPQPTTPDHWIVTSALPWLHHLRECMCRESVKSQYPFEIEIRFDINWTDRRTPWHGRAQKKLIRFAAIVYLHLEKKNQFEYRMYLLWEKDPTYSSFFFTKLFQTKRDVFIPFNKWMCTLLVSKIFILLMVFFFFSV